jgi:hypothetical protein
MKKYVSAIVIAVGALFGVSVQAAPLASSTTAVQTEVAQHSATQKVYWVHRGYGWRGRGWYGGWRGYGWRPRVYGAWGGYGWRRPYWRTYGWRGYGWRPRVYGAWGGYGWRRPYWRGYGWRAHRVYRRW